MIIWACSGRNEKYRGITAGSPSRAPIQKKNPKKKKKKKIKKKLKYEKIFKSEEYLEAKNHFY